MARRGQQFHGGGDPRQLMHPRSSAFICGSEEH
jgi:hypothetical protein